MKRKAPGILPNVAWLIRNGFSGLVAVMWKHPEAFAHITQTRKYRTDEEWVLEAEELARQHSGILPSPQWLTQHKHSGLYQAMLRSPDLFAHIERTHTGVEKWVSKADKLAEMHGGALPNPHWLINNGYSTLYSTIYRHPELFKHLKAQKKITTFHQPREWVPKAERLAKKHGGALPGPKWLNENGFSGLKRAVAKYPKLFAHIKKAPQGRAPKDWVPEAEKLAERNAGTLPNQKWLTINDYSGLAVAIRRHPELFAHIPQKRLQK